MGIDLISLSEYKSYKGINSTTNDIKIISVIPSVSAFIKNYCGRSFVDYYSTDKVEYFSNGEEYLLLEETPIKAITSVEYSSDFGKTYETLISDSDYFVDMYMGYIYIPGGFPKGFKAIKVTYTGGYQDIPKDLKIAALDLVDYYIHEDYRPKKAEGKSSIENSSVNVSKLPSHIKRILDMYREV